MGPKAVKTSQPRLLPKVPCPPFSHWLQVAERTITSDLEFLIAKAVDPAKADYAVVTGVQIHTWGQEFDGAEPNLEWVAPVSVYVVKGGKKSFIDLTSFPVSAPGRQPRPARFSPLLSLSRPWPPPATGMLAGCFLHPNLLACAWVHCA